MKAKETRIITASGVGALVIIIVLLLLRYLRQRNSPAITTNAVEIMTVTPTSSSASGYPVSPVFPTMSAYLVQYKPPILQNGQTLIEDIDLEGIVFGKHYDIRVIAPPWDSYNGVSIQLNPVAQNLIRIVIVNETGEALELPELTISALKLN